MMDPDMHASSAASSGAVPSAAELQAELVAVPAPPDQPAPVMPPGYDDALAQALRHVRGKRGGDLAAVILVGSGARRAITAHSDIDLIVLVKGSAEGHEIVRVGERLIDIRYGEHTAVSEDIDHSPRLPPLLRKGRILYDHDGIAAKLIEKAAQRFRLGPPAPTINEQIRWKAECLHWLGKAEDMVDKPGTAQYLLQIFFDESVTAFFRLRGFWLTAPVDVLRFMASRDPALGEKAARFLSAGTLEERFDAGRQFAGALFKDIPQPARID
jgi:predicted nucleotidyltransferase